MTDTAVSENKDLDVTRPDIVNYKAIPQHNGRYRLQRVPLHISPATSGVITLSAGATQEATIKFPAKKPFNLSRSLFGFQETIAAAALKANWTYEDTFAEAASVEFGNAMGMTPVNLQFANNYVSIVNKIDTDKKEFESSDPSSVLYPALDSDSNRFPPGYTIPALNNYGFATGTTVEPILPHDVQYARTTPDVGGDLGVNKILTRSRQIPMSVFKGTLLAMDKDVMFDEDMYLKIMLATSNKVGWTSTTNVDPTAGAAVLDSAAAAQPKLTNFYFYLAVQVDPVVEAYVKKRFYEGKLSFIFPWVQMWKTPTQGAGVTSISYTMPKDMGKYLKRVIHAPFNTAETLNTAYDHSNWNGVKWTDYQTTMDTNPLQNDKLSAVQPFCDDFRENQHVLKGSAIESSASYYLNWFHCDSFSNGPRDHVVPADNILEGLPMNQERTWSVTGTAGGNLSHNVIATFIRELKCLPGGTLMLSQ